MKQYLAIDIGASSGRHIVGRSERTENSSAEEVYRFPNGAKEREGHLVWDIRGLLREVKRGMAAAIEKCGEIESVFRRYLGGRLRPS